MRRFNLLTGDLDSDLAREGFAWRAAEIGEKIGGDKIGATLYDLPEGQQTWPYHYHHGVEEWAYVVGGSPTLRTPEGERTLKSGDVVCFPSGPDGAHAFQGPGQVVIFAASAKPSISAYPDSDKIGTRGDEEDRLNFMRADAVGYWDGE